MVRRLTPVEGADSGLVWHRKVLHLNVLRAPLQSPGIVTFQIVGGFSLVTPYHLCQTLPAAPWKGFDESRRQAQADHIEETQGQYSAK